MANAPRDENNIPALLGTSSGDGRTPVTLFADASTHRLLVSTTALSLSAPYVAKTGTYVISATDYTINATANSFTITLPTAVGIAGRIYVIKNSGSGTITVATTSAQTIDGQSSETLSQYDFIQVQSDGANWITIA